MSIGTFYNWRSKCTGLEVNEAMLLKELEVEGMKSVLSKKW